MHRAARVIPARIFIDGSANEAVKKELQGCKRAMTVNFMERMMRARSLALMIAGVLGLSAAYAPSAQGQAVPRQLPPEPLPELPSVSDYSLPPGDGQTPASNQAEGPVEENAAPPQATPNPGTIAPSAQPVPVTPLPQAETTPANNSSNQSTPQENARPSIPVSSVPPVTSAQQPNSNSNATPTPRAPSINENQPQPGFTTDLPGQPLPSDAPALDIAPEAAPSATPRAKDSEANIFHYLTGGLILLLFGGLGLFFWRRKAAMPVYEEEVVDDLQPEPATQPVLAPTPRKPAPKIYSPPNPAEPENPSPISSDGFIVSNLSTAPEPAPAARSAAPATLKPTGAAKKGTPDHLQIEFTATGASSTLLNAVLNYTITLTNMSDEDMRDICLSGLMTQADSEIARNHGAQKGELLHKTQNLPAGETVTLKGDIRLPLSAIRPITFKSQALFIPLARFVVRYTGHQDVENEQSASFIVGREYEPPRPKMAPFRLDLGPRNFSPVGHRPLNA